MCEFSGQRLDLRVLSIICAACYTCTFRNAKLTEFFSLLNLCYIYVPKVSTYMPSEIIYSVLKSYYGLQTGLCVNGAHIHYRTNVMKKTYLFLEVIRTLIEFIAKDKFVHQKWCDQFFLSKF